MVLNCIVNFEKLKCIVIIFSFYFSYSISHFQLLKKESLIMQVISEMTVIADEKNLFNVHSVLL